MLRIYSLNGKISAYPAANISGFDHETLLKQGWVHTATIDPRKWIEELCNGYGNNVDEMIDELHLGPAVMENV